MISSSKKLHLSQWESMGVLLAQKLLDQMQVIQLCVVLLVMINLKSRNWKQI